MKKLFFMLSVVFICILTLVTASAEDIQDVYCLCKPENEDTRINTQIVSDTIYLFLPSSADLTQLVLYSDSGNEEYKISADRTITTSFGEPVDILALFNDSASQNGEFSVTISTDAYSKTVVIMKSENIKSLFIVSEDPVNNGRKWIDSSKSNKATGNMVFVDADGNVINADEITEVKARGNSTFTDFEKKAYQIKIKNKFNMTGDENNAQKKWVLLANAGDITLIHNSLVTTLAKDIGLPYTIDNTPIDLFYDGEYRGSYLLTDKVEVGEENVDIQDLDGIIEEDNEGADAYEEPVVVTKTTASKGKKSAPVDSNGSYKFVKGLKEPALEEGTNHHAYLLELDFIYRYADEQSGFVTSRGQAVVTKNPEYLTKKTGAYISQFYQDFEDAVFGPEGYNEKTGKYYYEYCDLDSLVKIYLINEFTKNYDSYRSSTYFYLPEDEDIMYAGPIWDYDLCFTTGYDYNSQIAGNPENFWAATKYLASTLIKIESFRDAVKEYLDSEDGVFYKAAANMLGEDGNIMKYSQNIYASQRMNYKLWSMTLDKTAAFRCADAETYDNGVDFLLDFATERLEWLSETTSEWNGDNYSAPMDPTKWSATRRYHEPVTINKMEPTCTTDGMTEGSVCKGNCGKVFVKREVIPATGHDYVEIETKVPTCTQEGSKTFTCSVCGYTYEEVIPVTEHNGVWETIIYEDVGVPGLKHLICTECGNILDEIKIPAIGQEVSTDEPDTEIETEDIHVHEFDFVEVIPPTCTEKGYSIYSCDCGDSYVADEVAATGHDYVEIETKAPTCEEKGEMTFTCSLCGDSYAETIAMVDHESEWIVVKPAEICVPGLRQLVCTVCETVIDEDVIPALEEPSTEEPSTEEPSTEEPSTEEPSTEEPSTEEPDKHEHDYIEVITKAPTCIQEGEKTFTCSVCGDSYFETMAVVSHNCDWIIVKPADIGVAGLRQFICSVCGEIIDEENIPAIEESSADTTEPSTVEDASDECSTDEPESEKPVQILPGDVDGDNRITASDARLALRIAAKLEPDATELQLMSADVIKDGNVEAKDARLILRVSAKLQDAADLGKI